MPQPFPVRDPETGHLVERDYFSITEVAEMLHISRAAAYQRMRADRWPHLLVGTRAWLSEEDIGAVVDSMRQNVGPEEREPGADLGISVPPDPWLTDEPADQNPGGIR